MITSMQNPRVKKIRSLYNRKGRERTGLFLVEGEKLVLEALQAAERGVTKVDTIFYDEDGLGSFGGDLLRALDGFKGPMLSMSSAVFRALADTETPQGIASVVAIPPSEVVLADSGQRALYLIIDGVQEPGNLGTMIRTAAGAGATGVFCLKGTVDPYNPKSLRATMGSIFRVPIAMDVDFDLLIRQLKGRGCLTIAGVMDGKYRHFEAPYGEQNAVIIGNEGQGISKSVLAAADLQVRIPLAKGVESLNAGVSAGILLYETLRHQCIDSKSDLD